MWQSEIREVRRRLVSSSISIVLTTGHSSYAAACSAMEFQQLFLKVPRNVSGLLFPLVAAAAARL